MGGYIAPTVDPTPSASPLAAPALRLFLALWPDAATRRAIAAEADRWQWPPGARRCAPQDWHVTLHFLGNVPSARLPELQAALSVPLTPFTWTLDGPQHWPRGLAVLASRRAAAPLAALHRRLARALSARHLPVENRPWRPHVTLARQAADAVCPAEWHAIAWPVRDYALVRATGDPRSRYEVLARYPSPGA